MGFKAILISLLMIGLFFIAMVSFNVAMIENNGGNISLKDNPAINSTFQDVLIPLGNISAVYNNQSNILAGSSQTTEFTSIPEAIEGVWTILPNIPNILFNLLFNLIFVELFGGDVTFAIIMLTLGSMITLVVVFGAIRWLRSGES